jgi:hypothetical protein
MPHAFNKTFHIVDKIVGFSTDIFPFAFRFFIAWTLVLAYADTKIVAAKCGRAMISPVRQQRTLTRGREADVQGRLN